jgi:signal transduction histidine kinase
MFILTPIFSFTIFFFLYITFGGIMHFEEREPWMAWFSFVIPITVGISTGYVLTKILFKRIVTSLDILATGVREISDGNLTYRIKHDKGNEFDAVCADFNEMAVRLHEMVEQRQSDERNRKELIAGISHDLRTPLTSIKAYIEGIKKGVAATPEMQKKYIDTIQEKTEDIEYIINQLFLFSKIDIGEFPFNLETTDIGDELNKTVSSLSDEYTKRGLEISVEENINEPVLIDIIQFRNVMQNIFNNSVKYGRQENGKSVIRVRKYGGHVAINITDNGAGVPHEMLANIFDVFYRGDASRTAPNKGSGLGLAICSRIIGRLNGTISAENAEAGGLRINILLPIQRSE